MPHAHLRESINEPSFQQHLPKTWLCECFKSDENANHPISPILVSAVTVIRDPLCNRRSRRNNWRIHKCGSIQEYAWKNLCINRECKIHQSESNYILLTIFTVLDRYDCKFVFLVLNTFLTSPKHMNNIF
uniref:Uncharacterized protein n=1 Tax=Heterorhabditis bacteriophora TaxID=37862 RepID=A0A1I7WTT5_HETBA